MTGTGRESGSDSRAQSSPIAIVLVFGLVIASTTIIVVAGGSAISSTQDQLGAQNAETKMTQLDSQMATVALGSAASQQVALGTSSNYKVNGSAGRINVTSSTNGTILDTNLGEVVYENDNGERVAYQGGGVWRAGANEGSVMVSPPEFHYQGGTLTLPLVTVANNASFNGKAVITRNDSVQKYPNETLVNPLEGGEVRINITTDYHQGWYTYINSRTEGSVKYVGPRTIQVTLTVPVAESFDNTVGVTESDSGSVDAIDDESDFSGISKDTGVSAPDADRVVEEKIDSCPAECEVLTNGSYTGSDALKAADDDTYYKDGSLELGSTEFDTDGNDMSVIVDGNLIFPTGGGSDPYEIQDGGRVTFYVRGNVDIDSNSEINPSAPVSDLVTIVHSDGSTIKTQSGSEQYRGLIYAPKTNLSVNGGGSNQDTIVGAVVVETATAQNSNGNVGSPGTPIDYELSFASSSTINYLHVSKNSVNVTAD